jgi:K+-sensing histidine kinase KdpD
MYFKKLLNLGRKKAGDDVGDGNVGSVASREARNLNDQQTSGVLAADNTRSVTKILTVQDGDHSAALVDYAMKMARKLDCEIVALDVSEEPLSFEGERRDREISRFRQRAESNAETLQLKAQALGVTCRHIVQVGKQEEVIKAVSREDAGIRYVLLKPAQEYVSADRRQARIPVVDLNCSKL